MKEYQLYIGGEFVNSVSGQTFDSLNPYNQNVVANVARAGVEDVHHAVMAARKAFDDGRWTGLSNEKRSALLKAISDAINEKKNELELLEVEDSGSTIRKAKEDVYLSARSMNYFSKLAAMDLTTSIEGLSKPGFSQNLLV
ncbi:MAG: aldehyde dehydrogenase family protein, partial [Bacteroidetes bacterium]